MKGSAFAILLALGGLGGCAGDGARSAEFEVPAGQYARAFDETRDVLAGYRFTLDRVDAAAGVIATEAKPTAGLATPWDREQTTLEQDLTDLFNKQQRTARVTFDVPGGAADLRTVGTPVHGRVEVVIERIRRPGWQLDSTSVRLSKFTQDPALVDRGLWPRYTTAGEQDPLLAERLAGEIRRRLGLPEPGREAPQGQKKPATRPGTEPGL